MNYLPISPITGKPSAIRAVVERTTYLRPPADPDPVVWRGRGGSTITEQSPPAGHADRGPGGTMLPPGLLPGAQIRGLSAGEAVRPWLRQSPSEPSQVKANVARSTPSGARSDTEAIAASMARGFDALSRRLDAVIARVDRAEHAQPQPPAMVTRASTYAGDYSYRLPVPKTGVVADANNTRTPALRAMIERSLGMR